MGNLYLRLQFLMKPLHGLESITNRDWTSLAIQIGHLNKDTSRRSDCGERVM